jgi:uncharacterized membrane protein YdjX (TVP38/TMEM64 family)
MHKVAIMPELEPESPPETSPPTRPQGKWWTRLAILAVVVLGVVVFYATGLNQRLSRDELVDHLDTYRARVRENLPLAALIFFAAYVSFTALSLPIGLWMSLLGGALFGRWLGTGIVIFAATIGASLTFLATRYMLGSIIQRRFGNRLAALNAGIEKDGAFYLFTLRLIPAVPFWLINLGMGLTRMRVVVFALVSFVGMLPGTFLYVNAGNELANIHSARDVASPSVIVSLALLGLLPLVLRKTQRYWAPGHVAKSETSV